MTDENETWINGIAAAARTKRTATSVKPAQPALDPDLAMRAGEGLTRGLKEAVEGQRPDGSVLGAVSIDCADRTTGSFAATVQGSSDLPYIVCHLPGQGWRCSCPAYYYGRPRPSNCKHILQCRAVFEPAAGGRSV